MIKKSFAQIVLFLTTVTSFAQNNVVQDSVVKPTIKLSFLDSIKNTFVVDETSDCIDNQYIKELSNTQDIFDGLVYDIKNLNLDNKVEYDLPTEVFKERLRLMDEKSPFNIDYNPQLENLVKSFLKNRKRSYERLMGLSQFYFPLFEEAMAKYNVPLEIKYLSIVESALRSSAVSRVGATGLWQFMFETGKQYGLKIDSYVDERKDTYKATDAAARYMMKMFEIFGDWEMVLASYNSGAGNVSKAIRRSGGHQNFWNIKKYLPRETQSYVPAFLATMYIFEYHKEHGLVPDKAVVNHFETDTIAVKRKMSFKQLADLLDISVSDIEFLNPSYKTKVIPFVSGRTNYVCLPKKKVAVFASNEDKLYAYIDHQESHREKYILPTSKKKLVVKDSTAVARAVMTEAVEEAQSASEVKKVFKTVAKIKYYKVKSGDNLSSIADEYNVTLAEIKKWNHLKGSNVQKGKRLKIVVEDRVAVFQKVKKADPEISKETPVAKSSVQVASEEKVIKKSVSTEKSKVHVVAEGETLTTIAKQHRLYVADIKKWNNLSDNNVKLGDKLKLVANVDLSDYEAPLAKPTTVVATIASNEFEYEVKKGESIFQIAKVNKVAVEDILNWNNLTSTNIKPGDRLKIEKTSTVVDSYKKKSKLENQELYIVQKGDSLFSISQKHHTTVAEIKKLNGIEENEIQPGMKLKINK